MRFSFLISFALLAVPALGQHSLRVGLLLSGNATRFSQPDEYRSDFYPVDSRPGLGYGAGLTATYALNARFGLRADLRWERRSPRIFGMFRDYANNPTGEGYIRRRYDWLTLPLLAQISLGQHAYLVAGPAAQFLLRQTDRSDWLLWGWADGQPANVGSVVVGAGPSVADFTSRLRRVSAGFVAGVGLRIAPARRCSGFVELTGSLMAAQVLRAGFGSYEELRSKFGLYGPSEARNNAQRSLTLSAGLLFGRPD